MTLTSLNATALSCALILCSPAAWSQSVPAEPAQAAPPVPSTAPAVDNTKSRKLFPPDLKGLHEMAVASHQEKEWLRFLQATIKLRALRPYEPLYMEWMVFGAAQLGKMPTAYNYMHVMQQQGLSFDFNSSEDTVKIRKTEVYDYLNDLMIKAGEPMGEGKVAFTLPETTMHPESIAWDDSRGAFLVGTLDTGVVFAVTPNGKSKKLLRASKKNGILAITGLVVDAARNRLWLSSAGVPVFIGLPPADLGRAALLEFDLKTLKLLNRFDFPVDALPHVPGRIGITPQGNIYIIDRAVPMVFRKMADGSRVEPFMAKSDMTGFKDMALSDTGTKIYIADAALGIVVVDIEAKTSTMLGVPETLNVGGISGLMHSEDSLLMLQNGITPQRLMRLTLAPNGLDVATVTPLAIALEEFDSPAFGVVNTGAIYYFAEGNKGDVNGTSAGTTVVKTPMVLSEPVAPVENRKYNADVAAKKAKH
ncbi:MAG: hypothetical protein EXR85_00815 [Xanthomonadales bacterium]|nr:hypothetical protein [Xanthomonadales bacterium]